MTKKALVRFDPKKPEKITSDFLAPNVTGYGEIQLISLKNGKSAAYGVVVYTGHDLNPPDLFAKLVDSKHKFASVDQSLKALEFYLQELMTFKIGQILELHPDDTLPHGFQIRKSSISKR